MRQRSCDDHPKYQGGCEPCNARSRVYESRRWYKAQQGERMSTGAAMTTTQVRELMAAGYRLIDMEKHSGIHFKQLSRLSVGGLSWVQLRTFHKVQRMYEELRWFPGPSNRAALRAGAKGWTPPELPPAPPVVSEDIVDDEVVRRLAAGDRQVCPTRGEQLAAWAVLEGKGLSADKIGRTLGVTERTIVRLRSGATVKPYPRRTG